MRVSFKAASGDRLSHEEAAEMLTGPLGGLVGRCPPREIIPGLIISMPAAHQQARKHLHIPSPASARGLHSCYDSLKASKLSQRCNNTSWGGQGKNLEGGGLPRSSSFEHIPVLTINLIKLHFSFPASFLSVCFLWLLPAVEEMRPLETV